MTNQPENKGGMIYLRTDENEYGCRVCLTDEHGNTAYIIESGLTYEGAVDSLREIETYFKNHGVTVRLLP